MAGCLGAPSHWRDNAKTWKCVKYIAVNATGPDMDSFVMVWKVVKLRGAAEFLFIYFFFYFS